MIICLVIRLDDLLLSRVVQLLVFLYDSSLADRAVEYNALGTTILQGRRVNNAFRRRPLKSAFVQANPRQERARRAASTYL
jgi:hypothetical protein